MKTPCLWAQESSGGFSAWTAQTTSGAGGRPKLSESIGDQSQHPFCTARWMVLRASSWVSGLLQRSLTPGLSRLVETIGTTIIRGWEQLLGRHPAETPRNCWRETTTLPQYQLRRQQLALGFASAKSGGKPSPLASPTASLHGAQCGHLP